MVALNTFKRPENIFNAKLKCGHSPIPIHTKNYVVWIYFPHSQAA